MHTASPPACLSVRLPAGQLASPSSVAPPIVFGKLVTVQHCFIVSVCPLWQTPGTPHRMQSDNVGRLTQRLLHRVGRCPLPGRRRPTTRAHGRRHNTTRQGARPLLCCVVLSTVHPCVGPAPRRISSLPLFVRLIDMTAEYTPHHTGPRHAI